MSEIATLGKSGRSGQHNHIPGERMGLTEEFIFLTNNFFLVINGMCLLLKFGETQNTNEHKYHSCIW